MSSDNEQKAVTKVVHSKSKYAWNVVSTKLGGKYKLSQTPYIFSESEKFLSEKSKNEALAIANFISYCFNISEGGGVM